MIVPSMTEEEIFKEITEDIADLDKQRERFTKEFRKLILKAVAFPVMKLYKCKSIKKNSFVLVYSAEKRGQHNNPTVGVFCIYERKEGKYVAAYNLINNKIVIYSPHFFLRYRERILKSPNMAMLDVIDGFLKGNWGLVSLLIDDNLEAAYQCFEGHYNNEVVDFVAATAGGFCFGENHGNISIVKTIVSKDMLREKQAKLYVELEKETNLYKQELLLWQRNLLNQLKFLE